MNRLMALARTRDEFLLIATLLNNTPGFLTYQGPCESASEACIQQHLDAYRRLPRTVDSHEELEPCPTGLTRSVPNPVY